MDIAEYEECPKGDKVVICDKEGCWREAVWQTENGEQLCSKHLADLEAEELMDQEKEKNERNIRRYQMF